MTSRQARIRVLRLAAQDLEAHIDSGSELITCDPHSGDDKDTSQPCKDCDRIVAAWRVLVARLRVQAGGR